MKQVSLAPSNLWLGGVSPGKTSGERGGAAGGSSWSSPGLEVQPGPQGWSAGGPWGRSCRWEGLWTVDYRLKQLGIVRMEEYIPVFLCLGKDN